MSHPYLLVDILVDQDRIGPVQLLLQEKLDRVEDGQDGVLMARVAALALKELHANAQRIDSVFEDRTNRLASFRRVSHQLPARFIWSQKRVKPKWRHRLGSNVRLRTWEVQYQPELRGLLDDSHMLPFHGNTLGFRKTEGRRLTA
jgi:hypothetical protein